MQDKAAYAYVAATTGEAFDKYAKACGLTSKSELLKLLIQRELRLKRLRSDRQSGASRQAPLGQNKTKVTAHLNGDLNKALSTHVEMVGLSISNAAAQLVEIELNERWLEAALSWKPAK